MIDKKEFLDDMESFLTEAEMEEFNVQLADNLEENKGLVIENKNSANFYIKQINKLKAEIEEINNFTNTEIKRIIDKHEQYRESCIKPIQNKINFYENALKSFMFKEYDSTKKRTIKLPEGTLSIKKQQPKYLYEDEALLEYLQNNSLDEYLKVKTTTEINKKDLKKAGEIVNGKLIIEGKEITGVEVIEQEDKFEVK